MDPVIATPLVTPPPAATPASQPGTPAAVAAPSAPAWIKPDGTLGENWLDQAGVDADLRSNKTISNLKTFGQGLRMLANAEALVGKKGSIIPTDMADAKTVDAYFRAVGWPESADKYPAIPAQADGLTVDPEMDKTLRIWSHKLHMTVDQYKGLVGEIIAYNRAEKAGNDAEAVSQQNTRKAALQTQWGPRYDYNVQMANTAAAAFMDEKQLAYARGKGWLEDPQFIQMFQKVGEAISPDRLHARSDGSPDTNSIQRQIEEVEASEAYRKSDHPRHQAVTDQVLNLRNQLVNVRSKASR